MLKNDTRKVYIVNNIKSDNIEQVIFILRTDINKKRRVLTDSHLAIEAQAIIDNYAKEIETVSHRRLNKPRKKKNKSLFKFLTFAGLTLITLLLVISYYSNYFI